MIKKDSKELQKIKEAYCLMCRRQYKELEEFRLCNEAQKQLDQRKREAHMRMDAIQDILDSLKLEDFIQNQNRENRSTPLSLQ